MNASTQRPVGFIYRWDDRFIYVNVTEDSYRPGLGDLLYVKPSEDVVIILQVVGFAGEIPASPLSISKEVLFEPTFYSLGKQLVAKASLFLEIRARGGSYEVFKPYQPPPLSLPVFRVVKGSDEASRLMKTLSEGIKHSSEQPASFVSIGWLRAGVAPVKSMKAERYFEDAPLKVSITDLVSKHILVVGQTGSGKTTGVMGIMVQWCKERSKGLSWVIIDRHGEYGRSSLINVIQRTLVPVNGSYSIYTVKVGGMNENVKGVVKHIETPIDVSSINLMDLSNVLIGREEKLYEIDEVLNTITNVLLILEDTFGSNIKPLVSVFLENDLANGNALALIPVLVDNVIRFEGVREAEKTGVYRELLDAGIDIRRLRVVRGIILQTLGLRLVNRDGFKVVDDSYSVFKVTKLLKDPDLLRKFLSLFTFAHGRYRTRKSSLQQVKGDVCKEYSSSAGSYRERYNWFDEKACQDLDKLVAGVSGEYRYLSIDNLVDEAEREGRIIVLDVSKIPYNVADLISMVIARRVFEKRLLMGVERIVDRHVVAFVSEEAPLYLSPDKVKNPFNVFARIAREGRKFKIGLIAISQIATIIERQILANFNTVVALRTKHPGDLNYFNEIGIPSENIPTLNDREGFLYTPDLNVKEPIPIYIPGYFEIEFEEDAGNVEETIKKVLVKS